MRRFSRREFLDEAFLSAALAPLAAAGLNASAEARSRPRAQDGKVRVGVIGVHGRGMDHVDGYLGLADAEVVAVCDVDAAVAARAAAKIKTKTGKICKVYGDLRQLFADKDIDAVSMALPIHWHTLAAYWAMQAGKDVYVEKPCSHNVHEGRILTDAQKRFNRICQVGTQSRSNKAVVDAIGFIHAGKIGKVRLARGLCYKRRESIGMKADAPTPDGVNYDIWLGAAPSRPFNPNRFHYNWHWNWDYGAGDVGNQGIHQMDIARWALDVHELPRAVQSVGGRFGYTDQGETPNTLVAFYDYGDKKLIFEVRGLPTKGVDAGKQNVAIGDIIYGSDGVVAFTANYGAAAAFDNAGNPLATFTGGGNHFRNFIDAVKSRKQSDLHAPVAEGHLSSALCHLGNVSYKMGGDVGLSDSGGVFGKDSDATETYARFRAHLTDAAMLAPDAKVKLGKWLTLDPKSEAFTGDSAANRLLTRSYRAPFTVPAKV